MAIVRRLISVIAALALVVSLVGLGFIACILPATTHGLATVFANDALSPFDRTQLVRVADATRDYAFGSHSKIDLYKSIWEVDKDYQYSLQKTGGKTPPDFPRVDSVTSASTEPDFAAAFLRASDVYCYTEAEIVHLDDCYAVYTRSLPIIIVAFVLAIGGLIAVGVLGKKRNLGNIFTAGGSFTILLFVLLALWALIDFNGFFASFHKMFFVQGSWTFPSDSLLICALPEGFWIGMGAVWLIVAFLGAIICIGIGRKLRRK